MNCPKCGFPPAIHLGYRHRLAGLPNGWVCALDELGAQHAAQRAAAARHLLRLRAERYHVSGNVPGVPRNQRFWDNANADIFAAIAMLRVVGIMRERKP